MLKVLPILLFLLSFNYGASLYEKLEEKSCSMDEFKGIGISDSEIEAIGKARAVIAAQIVAKVSARQKSVDKMTEHNGKETTDLQFEQHIESSSKLENAGDAKVVFKKSEDGQIGIVACMSKSDAAKPYLDRQKRMADSLSLAVKTELSQKNPKSKTEAWKRGERLFYEIQSESRILESLDISSGINFSQTQSQFEKMKDDYMAFCLNHKLYWIPSEENEGYSVLYSKLSQKFKFADGSFENCENGLQVEASNTGAYCSFRNASVGYVCSFEPSLKGSSCTGELLFQIQLSPRITSTAKQEDAALRKLWIKTGSEKFSKMIEELSNWAGVCK